MPTDAICPSGDENSHNELQELIARIPALGAKVAQGPGRRSVLTRSVAQRIIAAILTGHYLRSAALLAGVPNETAHQWMKDGTADSADPDDPRTLFAQAVLMAEAAATDAAIRRVRAAGDKDWKAEMTWLGRRHREEWAEQRPEDRNEAKVQVLIGLALPGTQAESAQVIEARAVSVPRLPRD